MRPYIYDFQTHAKERWLERTVIDVFGEYVHGVANSSTLFFFNTPQLLVFGNIRNVVQATQSVHWPFVIREETVCRFLGRKLYAGSYVCGRLAQYFTAPLRHPPHRYPQLGTLVVRVRRRRRVGCSRRNRLLEAQF